MSIIEMTTFEVAPEKTQAMLSARAAMLADFRADRRGFVAAKLIRLDPQTWLDTVEWADDTAWDASREKGPNRPGIAAFFATIDRLVDVRRGVRYDDEADGRRGVRTVAFGPHPSQVGELYLPGGVGPFPVVVLVHGGYWAAMFDRRQMTPLADDLIAAGYAVWNLEYRRIGEDGGGWPGTFTDIAAGVDALVGLDAALDTSRVAFVGHSEGGHLAVWAARREGLPAGAVGSNPQLVPAFALALGAPLDLVAADRDNFGADLAGPDTERPAGAPAPADSRIWPAVADQARDGIVKALLGGHRDQVPERFAVASPAEMSEATVPIAVVHGDADGVVPAAYGSAFVARAAGRGENVRWYDVPGAGHFDPLDPTRRSWTLARRLIADRIAP